MNVFGVGCVTSRFALPPPIDGFHVGTMCREFAAVYQNRIGCGQIPKPDKPMNMCVCMPLSSLYLKHCHAAVKYFQFLSVDEEIASRTVIVSGSDGRAEGRVFAK